jgi:DNA polymerase-3 subunit alpha
MIFQFESDFARQSIKKMQPRSVDDICLCSACLRPSSESYREQVFEHKWNKNPSKLIDDILSNSYGYLVYQCQTIAFLQQVCGFSGSEADNIRRSIGKKDKEKIAKALPQILEGYCNKSDKPREVAEEEAKQFIKVIEDASGYSFGFNHSESYAMLGYLMGWLRYYYPTEFCTAFLNCAKNDEDLANGQTLAKSRGITIESPKFRFSTAEYGCDPKNKIIYKGVSSIKNIGQSCADNLYALKDRTYSTFVDLLYDIWQTKACNKTELEILIKLDYFKEFGNIQQLLMTNQMFRWFMFGKSGNSLRKTIKREDCNEQIQEIIARHCEKETEKQFSGIDNLAICKECEQLLHYTTNPLMKLYYEVKYLGYTNMTVESPYYAVEAIETNKWGNTFVTLYKVSNGQINTFKVNKKEWSDCPMEQGDIVDCMIAPKEKVTKGESGWVGTGEYEDVVQMYSIKFREN